ncbi:MAG: hypothetical protein IPI35_07130 [Deltaproteobacteria bacterium]|nr:hypothetical protein [Deltaproteobacteria bacterium]
MSGGLTSGEGCAPEGAPLTRGGAGGGEGLGGVILSGGGRGLLIGDTTGAGAGTPDNEARGATPKVAAGLGGAGALGNTRVGSPSSRGSSGKSTGARMVCASTSGRDARFARSGGGVTMGGAAGGVGVRSWSIVRAGTKEGVGVRAGCGRGAGRSHAVNNDGGSSVSTTPLRLPPMGA